MRLHSLQAKILGLVVGVLLPLLALTAWWTTSQVRGALGAQTASAARSQAESIASAIEAFGEAGEMDGLDHFLKGLTESNPELIVRAVRAAGTEGEYGVRKSSPAPDAVEQRAISTNQMQLVEDAEAHTVRFVAPILNAKDCMSCHSEAKEGAVLGTSSVQISTAEVDAAEGRLILFIAALLGGALVLAVVSLSMAVSRIAIRPIQQLKRAADRLAEGDITGAEQAMGGQVAADGGRAERGADGPRP